MNTFLHTPQRGEIWRLKSPLNGATKPGVDCGVYCVVVSADAFNDAGLDLFIGVPLTCRDLGLPLHVQITPATPQMQAYAKCEELRCVPLEALDVLCGRVDDLAIALLADRMRIILDL